MNAIIKFVSGLFSRAERPAPKPQSKPEYLSFDPAPGTSALSRGPAENSALAERDYTVDSQGIKWHRLT